MAYQDFKVTGGVQVGKAIKNLSSDLGSTTTIDVSSSDYFYTGVLSENATFTFNTPKNVQMFQLEVVGGSVPFDISAASWDMKYFYVGSQGPRPEGLFFKPDGLSMYTVDLINDTVYQYTLSTAWDVSTASYASKSLDISGQTTDASDIYIGDGGSSVYVVCFTTDSVFQYTLSTPWDVSTGSYSGKSFSIAAQETFPRGLFFKPDGTKMYLLGTTNDTVYQYTLSTAWDVSTASYDVINFFSGSNPSSLYMTNDGLKMFLITGGTILSYTLGTAWSVNTAVYDGYFISTRTLETSPYGIFFSENGDKFYFVGETNDTVYQYSTSPASITWPVSVKWSDGVAPSSPSVGYKNVYTFFTDDAGTTYYGFSAGEGFA